jgi:UPF0176 protein
MPWTVATFYQFVPLPDCREWAERLLEAGTRLGLCGTFILAEEGLNTTVAGEGDAIAQILAFLQQDDRFAELVVKTSTCEDQPFPKYKVKVKPEIVTFGNRESIPSSQVGEYVKPADWNELISDPDVVLVDTRNDYEVEVGRFKGAMNPKVKDFTEFGAFVEQELDPQKHKKVAMYCTGGIRCEKATAHLLNQGFETVYHLEGGILKYLEEVPKERSLWEGDCFVFDWRVALNHDLKPGGWRISPHTHLPEKTET